MTPAEGATIVHLLDAAGAKPQTATAHTHMNATLAAGPGKCLTRPQPSTCASYCAAHKDGCCVCRGPGAAVSNCGTRSCWARDSTAEHMPSSSACMVSSSSSCFTVQISCRQRAPHQPAGALSRNQTRTSMRRPEACLFAANLPAELRAPASACLHPRCQRREAAPAAEAADERVEDVEERGVAPPPHLAEGALHPELEGLVLPPLPRRRPVWKPNLQPEFNVRSRDSFDAISSAVLRELDESNRFVQKSAESTSI